MPPPNYQPGGAEGLALRGFTMVADRVIGVIRSVFGGAPNDNELPAYYSLGSASGTGTITLAATIGVIASGSAVIDAGSDFICTRITKIDTDADGVVLTTVPSYSVQFQYTGNAKNIVFTGAAHGQALMGDGFQSVPLAKNWLIKRGSTVTAQLTNLKAIAAVAMIVMHGFAVFDRSMLNRTMRQ